MGSTLHNALVTCTDAAHVYQPKASRKEIRDAARQTIQKRRCNLLDLKIVHGHSVFEGLHTVCPKQPRYFTFLRDPVAKRLSLYNYFRMIIDEKDHWRSEHYRDILSRDGNLMEFEEWLEYRVNYHNAMSRFIASASVNWVEGGWPAAKEGFDLAKGFLHRMHFVGFVEQSQSDLPLICNEIGIETPTKRRNVSKTYFKLDQQSKLRQRIQDLDSYDVELYDYAMTHFNQRGAGLRRSA